MKNLFWKFLIILGLLLNWHLTYAETLNLPTLKFHNPLMLSAQKGQLSDLIDLLKKGYSPNTKEHNITPLFIAASMGNIQMVEKLINAGADANSVDSEGNTSLHFAYNKPEIVDFLIKNGTNPLHYNKNNKSIIELAIQNNNIDTLKILAKNSVFTNLSISERTKLLNLSSSSAIKKIISPESGLNNSTHTNLQNSTYILAKEDLVELPSGSSIVIANSNLKTLNNSKKSLGHKVDNNISGVTESAESIKEVKPTIVASTDTQPKTSEAVASPQAKNIFKRLGNTFSNFSSQGKNLASKKSLNDANKRLKLTNNIQTRKFLGNNLNTLWVEIWVKTLTEANKVSNQLMINKVLSHPIRVQTIKSLSNNNTLSVRAGPFLSFYEARLICKLIDSSKNTCSISDSNIIQPLKNTLP